MMLILTQALIGFGNIEWQAWHLTEQNISVVRKRELEGFVP
jgi:hypothetical protein